MKQWYDILLEEIALQCGPPDKSCYKCDLWDVEECKKCWKEYGEDEAFEYNMNIATKVAIGLRLWYQNKKQKQKLERRKHKRVRLKQ